MDPMQTQSASPATEGKKSFGPLVGVIIIVILLVLGAFYMMKGNEATQEASDEISSIESELQTAGVADVDLSELESI